MIDREADGSDSLEVSSISKSGDDVVSDVLHRDS